jgi:hypothetical protein
VRGRAGCLGGDLVIATSDKCLQAIKTRKLYPWRLTGTT